MARVRPAGGAGSRGLTVAWAAAAVALLVLLGLAAVERADVMAQWRASVVLADSLDTPGLTTAVDAVTGAPAVRDVAVAGVPCTVAVPAGGGRRGAVVFLNGVTRDGPHEQHVVRLVRGLSRAGLIAVVPDLPGLRDGAITTRTLAAARRVVDAVSRRPDVARTTLLGVSVGGSIGLDVAEQESSAGLADVSAIAPYVDLRAVVILAVTGRYPVDGGLVAYDPNPFLRVVVTRSLAAGLPAGAPGGPVARLLRSRDPATAAARYAALPAGLRAGLAALSPLPLAGRLHVPVVLATAPHDKYFPLAGDRPLLRAEPRVRLTVTPALQHAVPHASVGDLTGLVRLDGFAVRTLRRAAGPVPVNWLAVVLGLAALALLAAVPLAGRRLALLAAVALTCSVLAFPHPTGVRWPQVVAVLALGAGGYAAGISSGRS